MEVIDGDGESRSSHHEAEKIGPELWSHRAIEEVDKVLEDINGLKVYKGASNEKSSIMSAAKDGRPWRKDPQTEFSLLICP